MPDDHTDTNASDGTTPDASEADETDDPEPTDEWRVLAPVAVLDGETVPTAVAEWLSTVPVTLLGYHQVPEQTAPGQARMQFEDRAQRKLDELAATFEAAGGTVETQLVFTRNAEQSIDRVADERGCRVLLHPNPAAGIERVLVAVGDRTDAVPLATFLAALLAGRPLELTLLHVTRAGDETVLTETAKRLAAAGVPADRITSETVAADGPVAAITDRADTHDAVVMGESDPSLRSAVFGETADRVADRTLGPVLVVRSIDE